jgi:hypothetical protein
MNFTLTVEIGGRTAELLERLFGATVKTSTAQPIESDAPVSTAQEEKPKNQARSGGTVGKTPKEEPIKEQVRTFADLTEEEQIEAIKAEVVKHTKRGKSADIKAMLTFVGADRVSNLQGGDIAVFMEMLQQYGLYDSSKGEKGKSLEQLTSLD